MNPLLSLDSSPIQSDVFYVECSSEEGSPKRNNTPAVLKSTELSGAMARRTTTIPSVASLEPLMVTIDSDSNELTVPHGSGSQHPIVPPSLNDLNLTPNPFNVLSTIAVIRKDEAYSSQSPEPSIPLPISTPQEIYEYHWRLGYNAHNHGWCHILFILYWHTIELRRVYWGFSSSDTFDPNEPKNVSIASSLSST